MQHLTSVWQLFLLGKLRNHFWKVKSNPVKTLKNKTQFFSPKHYFSHHWATQMIMLRIVKGNMHTLTETVKFMDKKKFRSVTKVIYYLIAFNLSSDIDFKDLINLYKKCTTKSYSLLIIDATLASDNPLRLRRNLVERM